MFEACKSTLLGGAQESSRGLEAQTPQLTQFHVSPNQNLVLFSAARLASTHVLEGCISGSTVEIMRRRMVRQVEVVNQFEIVSSLSAFLVPARLRAGRLSSWMAKHSQNFSMPQSPNTLDRQSGDVSCRLQECSKIAAEAHRSSKP